MHAQIFALSRGTRGACRGDEEFGGHASDASAGCAERATVAQKGGRAESFRGSSCDEAGASGADDDDIYFIVRVRHVLLRSVRMRAQTARALGACSGGLIDGA